MILHDEGYYCSGFLNFYDVKFSRNILLVIVSGNKIPYISAEKTIVEL